MVFKASGLPEFKQNPQRVQTESATVSQEDYRKKRVLFWELNWIIPHIRKCTCMYVSLFQEWSPSPNYEGQLRQIHKGTVALNFFWRLCTHDKFLHHQIQFHSKQYVYTHAWVCNFCAQGHQKYPTTAPDQPSAYWSRLWDPSLFSPWRPIWSAPPVSGAVISTPSCY